MRRITITTDDSFKYSDGSLDFDETKVKDSEAFKTLICEVDPGPEYVVNFETIVEFRFVFYNVANTLDGPCAQIDLNGKFFATLSQAKRFATRWIRENNAESVTIIDPEGAEVTIARKSL